MKLDIETVKLIVHEQFPEFKDLEIKEVENNGHDNITYHLGHNFSLRFPSASEYASQVLKEHQFCAELQKSISASITQPYALGKPSKHFPFNFSINQWIEGETANLNNIHDLKQFAIDCAIFLNELHSCDISHGPLPGLHNFHRGGNLEIYHNETISAIKNCTMIDQNRCLDIWHNGLKSIFNESVVWVHGDFAVGNIIIRHNRLYAVIDFGSMAIGDPACDYVIAWTFLDQACRKVFFDLLNVNQETVKRARAWALWKALITINDPKHTKLARYTLNQLLNDVYE